MKSRFVRTEEEKADDFRKLHTKLDAIGKASYPGAENAREAIQLMIDSVYMAVREEQSDLGSTLIDKT